MECIYQNLQPRHTGFDHLAEWARPNLVRLLSFWFFRPATTELLKSLEGFWRSLCFQIISTDEKLTEKIRRNDDGSAPENLRYSLAQSGSRTQTWTNFELRSWFTYLLTHSEYNYCILVDGLNEVANNRDALLKAVQYVACSSKSVKVCCSSRAETVFQQVLYRYPSLRLQDFNRKVIEIHCRQRLANTRAARLADTITFRAEGVFLWAYLVTEDLRIAVGQGDVDKDLELRLEECPAEMNELFALMLERHDRFYTKHPKPYLRLISVIATKTDIDFSPTYLELHIASQDQQSLVSNFPNHLDSSFLAALDTSAIDLEANVAASCAGLVESFSLYEVLPQFPTTFPYKALAHAHNRMICFIHRSAQDFLVDSEKGAAFLQSSGISEQDALKRLLTAATVSCLINANDKDLLEPLQYGEYILAESWTPVETCVVDTLFWTMQSRRQMERSAPLFEPKNEQRRFNSNGSNVTCPHLSSLENLAFGYTVTFNMTAYLEAKLSTFDLEKIYWVAAFSICLCLLSGKGPHQVEISTDFVFVLKPYLSMTQNLNLCYNGGSTGPCFTVTRPLWQHLYLALMNKCYGLPPNLYRQDLVSLVHDVPPGNSEQAISIEGWIICWNDEFFRAKIFPVPDEAADFTEGQISGLDVLRVRVLVQELPVWEVSSVEFCQYSPKGLDRFFSIEYSVNEHLQQNFYDCGNSYPAWSASAEDMATILNHHLDELSSFEIAKVVCLHSGNQGTRLIFSKGQICDATLDERERWEERLQEGRFRMDFETDPQHDPILSEIMREMQLS
jgi:hypothetical protein